jgi:hypothetical protein
MKCIYFILFVLISSISVNAQRVDNLFQKNIDIHLDLAPLGFPDPSLRIGSEMMLGNRWSVGMNLGVGVPIRGNTGLGFREPKWKKGQYRLFEARPEVKFYWFKRERSGWYIAAEGLVSTMKGTSGEGYHFMNDNDTLQVNFEQADYSKTKIGAIGKLGGRIIIGQRMTVDFFTGLGLSKTNSRYSNYQNRTISKSDPFFEGENYTAGKRITGHLSVGLRLGIILWSKNTD